MSERYFVTGVQLGMLKATMELMPKNGQRKVFENIWDEIFDKQFIGNVSYDDEIVIRASVERKDTPPIKVLAQAILWMEDRNTLSPIMWKKVKELAE